MAGAIDVDKALEAARKFPGLKGMDLAKVVSTADAYPWREGQLDLDSRPGEGTRARMLLPLKQIAPVR